MADDLILDAGGSPIGVRRPNQRTDVDPRVVYLTEGEAAEHGIESEDGSADVIIRADSPIATAVLYARSAADVVEVTVGDVKPVSDILGASDGLS